MLIVIYINRQKFNLYICMPKNKGGGKHKHRKKSSYQTHFRKVEELMKNREDGTVYGKVIKVLGQKRFSVRCQDLEHDNRYKVMNCGMKGSLRGRIEANMFVLVQDWRDLSSTGKNKGTIVNSYKDHDIDTLTAHGQWDYEEEEVKYKGITFDTSNEADANMVETLLKEAEADKCKRDDSTDHYELDIDAI